MFNWKFSFLYEICYTLKCICKLLVNLISLFFSSYFFNVIIEFNLWTILSKLIIQRKMKFFANKNIFSVHKKISWKSIELRGVLVLSWRDERWFKNFRFDVMVMTTFGTILIDDFGSKWSNETFWLFRRGFTLQSWIEWEDYIKSLPENWYFLVRQIYSKIEHRFNFASI